MDTHVDLSAIVPATDAPPQDLNAFLGELQEALSRLEVNCELLLVASHPNPRLLEMAARNRARLIEADAPGYGTAISAAFAASRNR